MNTNQKHPNLEISTHGTLNVMPVDADALKKMINDAIADMDSKVTKMEQTINDEIEALKQKANPNIDYNKKISYSSAQLAKEMKDPGYIEVPCDGFLSVITYWDDAWITVNALSKEGFNISWGGQLPSPNFIYYSWGIYKSRANGQGLIPVYKGQKLYAWGTRMTLYGDMNNFCQFVFLPFA